MVTRPQTSPAKPVSVLRHLPGFVKLYWRLLHDRRVPLLPKALLITAILYVVVPFDFDYLPVLGQLDDLVVLILACRWFIRLCPPPLVEEHVARIDRGE